jgi:hypothetical protein
LRELRADTPTVDEARAVERRLGEVTTGEVAPHELDVDQPRAREGVARMPRADDFDADELAVVVEIEAIGISHCAILALDVVTRHTRAFPFARLQ